MFSETGLWRSFFADMLFNDWRFCYHFTQDFPLIGLGELDVKV